MITQNRWQHILSVARKAKALAEKFRPNNPQFAEDMFLLGLLHDIGYEFSETGTGHASLGGEILKRNDYRYWSAVAHHGYNEEAEMTDELFILDCADMLINIDGSNCTIQERLADIARRYGQDSAAYQSSLKQAEKLKTDPRFSRITI